MESYIGHRSYFTANIIYFLILADNILALLLVMVYFHIVVLLPSSTSVTLCFEPVLPNCTVAGFGW